jgi:transposase
MRGTDRQQSRMFRYISAEQRVSDDHPLGTIRLMVGGVLRQLGPRFDSIYAKSGRPSIAPEKLVRALLLQVLYTVRSERIAADDNKRINPDGGKQWLSR